MITKILKSIAYRDKEILHRTMDGNFINGEYVALKNDQVDKAIKINYDPYIILKLNDKYNMIYGDILLHLVTYISSFKCLYIKDGHDIYTTNNNSIITSRMTKVKFSDIIKLDAYDIINSKKDCLLIEIDK